MCLIGIPLFLLIGTGAFSQSTSEQLTAYMERVRQGSLTAAPTTVLADTQNTAALLDVLNSYYKDSVVTIRATAYDLSKRIALKSSDPELRRSVVNSLINALKDKDSGVAGRAARGLTYFKKNDFDAGATGELTGLLVTGQPHLDKIIRLAGFVGNAETIPSLKALTHDNIGRTAKWSAYLGMARLGDEQALEKVLSSVKDLRLNDDVVEELLPDLIYTRQPSAFGYLIQVLNSNDTACESTDADTSANIVCGYRVMEYLSPVVEKFPIELDASGELVTNNYEAALQEVRGWFRSNPGYNIISDTF